MKKAASSQSRTVQPNRVLQQHAAADRPAGSFQRLGVAWILDRLSVISPPPQQTVQLLPPSRVPGSLHRLAVLSQEKPALVAGQLVQNPLRVERVPACRIDRLRAHSPMLASDRAGNGDFLTRVPPRRDVWRDVLNAPRMAYPMVPADTHRERGVIVTRHLLTIEMGTPAFSIRLRVVVVSYTTTQAAMTCRDSISSASFSGVCPLEPGQDA